jgi:hypothetical protein
MALTVEDGSIVTGANSYVSLQDARDYASARGVDLPTDDGELEVLLIKAMDWIESMRDDFRGYKRTDDQPLQWPRYEVYVDWYYVESDTIPRELRNAQMAAAVELHEGNELLANESDSGPVQQESVGDISVTYATRQRAVGPSAFAKPYAQLAPLLRKNGMRVVRA